MPEFLTIRGVLLTKIRGFLSSVSAVCSIVLILLFPQVLFAQTRLDVTGDLKIRGRMDVSVSPTNTSSLFIGKEAGLNNSTGTANTFLGALTGRLNTTGSANNAFGYAAFYANTTGIQNTVDGVRALYSNRTGTFNTGIGYGVDVSLSDLEYAVAIGTFALSIASKKTVIGLNTTGLVIGGYANWSNQLRAAPG